VARIRAIVHTSFSLSTLFSRRALALCRRAPGDVAKLEIDKAARRQARQNTFPGGGVSRNSNSLVGSAPRPTAHRRAACCRGCPGARLPHGKPPVRLAPGSLLWLAAVALARTQTPAMDKRDRHNGIAQRPQARLGPRPPDGLARTTGQCHFQAAHPRPPTSTCAYPAPAARSFS